MLDKRIHNALKGAKMLGVGYAVIHPNTTTVEKIKFDEEDSFNSVISYLAPYVERAEREGVKLLVENMRPVNKAGLVHRYCMEPDELCRVADKLGIGVCWDFGHANIAGIRQSRALEYVGSRLKLLHVNDNFAVDDEHLIPFHGNIDWKDAMHGLSLAGYEGLFNFELNTSRLPASVRRTYASHVVEVAQELMTYIK